jgi:ferritin-like metal-binding protein YciE
MALDSLQDLLLDELRDLYHAELQIAKALPRLAKAVRTPALRNALRDHLEETEEQILRLEQVFDQLGVRGTGRKSRAMFGLLDEGNDLMDVDGSDAVRDAALIVSIQRVEHYEIATYGTVITHAKMLGHTRIARLLEQSLDEEKKADELLTRIAEEQVNRMALAAGQYDDRFRDSARDGKRVAHRDDDEDRGIERLGMSRSPRHDDRLEDRHVSRNQARDRVGSDDEYATRNRGEDDSWGQPRQPSRR